MAYIKVLDLKGIEHEFQVRNLSSVSVSEGFGKYKEIDDIIEDEVTKQTEAYEENSLVDEDAIIADYFFHRDLDEVLLDRYDFSEIITTLNSWITDVKNKKKYMNSEIKPFLLKMKEIFASVELEKDTQ